MLRIWWAVTVSRGTRHAIALDGHLIMPQGRILVVDDEPDALRMLELLLNAWARLVYMLTQIAKVLELTEIERRLARLEDRV